MAAAAWLRCIAAAVLCGVSLSAVAADFEGTVTHVSDGDTLWVRPAHGGPARKVRLQGIDAPEICQPHGVRSRDALAARVLHRRVRVASQARDSWQRTLGQVSLEGRDLGDWMVSHGHAWSYRYRGHPGPYRVQQTRARAARLGLWSDPAPIEPRQFRQWHGSCQ